MTQTDSEKDGEFRRPIRSFVKRQGRLTAGQRRALEQGWSLYGIDYKAQTLDLNSAFERRGPVVLEIGFGNGENLVDMAQREPEQNFLGIEVHEPGVGHCLLNIANNSLGNVRVLRHDAIEVLHHMIEDHSLARVNLFFPDPWPKKRHHKRRIVQRSFVELVAQKLAPDGIFHVATDWENYAEHIAAVMTEVIDDSSTFTELASPPGDRSVSRFDSRGQRLGHNNWERAWRRGVEQ